MDSPELRFQRQPACERCRLDSITSPLLMGANSDNTRAVSLPEKFFVFAEGLMPLALHICVDAQVWAKGGAAVSPIWNGQAACLGCTSLGCYKAVLGKREVK